MNFTYMKTNITKFIILYFVLLISFIFISYKFFIGDFIYLEKTQNINNINSLVNNIDKNLKNISSTAHDYSQWDDSYEFAKNKNKAYIYENFREGALTLEGLDLDAMIYLGLDNKVFFSKYRNDFLQKNKEDFENYLIKKFKNKNTVDSIVNYNSNFIYLSKSKILRSDLRGDARGYIITIQLLNNMDFLEEHSLFNKIKISTRKSLQNDFEMNLTFLKNVKIKTQLKSDSIVNYINFYTQEEEYIITLISKNSNNIIQKGKRTILLFNLVISIILLFIFFFIYKNQFLIENQNSMLNKEVENRTELLNKAYSKLKDKNSKLYALANIDSLTKIRNRRNYFIKSEVLLKNAIKLNKNLFVLLIDLDYFKKINDTYGHAAGDKVLIRFCKIVSSIIDEETIFGRIGGEEFSITFYDISSEKVHTIAEEIRNRCANEELNIDDKIIRFTVSMGLTPRADFTNIDKIMHNSDNLLYEAKNSGRNKLIRTNR